MRKTKSMRAISILSILTLLALAGVAHAQDGTRQFPLRRPGQAQVLPTKVPAKLACPVFTFASTSPLPPTAIGGNYTYQLQTSGGIAPITFFIYRQGETGWNSPDQIPRGLTVSPSGLISGQVDGSIPAQNYYFEVGAVDNCPSGARFVSRKFYLLVKPY